MEEKSQTDLEFYCGILGNIQKAEELKSKIDQVMDLKKGLIDFWNCLVWTLHEWPPIVETHKKIGNYDLFITLKQNKTEEKTNEN